MKTYIYPQPDVLPEWRVPKLHEGMAPKESDPDQIREWCHENCRAPYYLYPSWMITKGAQFEDDDDARQFIVWSRLRWG